MARQFLTPIDLGGLELRQAVIHPVAALPPDGQIGQICYLTTGGPAAAGLYVHRGVQGWLRLVLGAGDLDGQALLDQIVSGAFMGAESGLDADFWRGLSPAQFVATQVRSEPLSAFQPPTGPLAMGGQRITAVGAPTAPTDAARLLDVQQAALGIDAKESVGVRASSALAPLLGLSHVIDDVQVTDKMRVLLTAQGNPEQNGIWVAGAGPWARPADAVPGGTLTVGALTYVEAGNAHRGEVWILRELGAGPGYGQQWVQFGAATPITAGAGLTASGGTYNVGAGTGISVTADAVAINTAVVPRKAVFAVGGSAAQALVHNLGTRDVAVSVLRATAPYDQVECGVEATDASMVTLRFAVAPAAGAYRAIVVG